MSVERSSQQPEVDRAAAQTVQQHLGLQLVDLEYDIREQPAQLREQPRQAVRGDGRDHAQSHRPVPHPGRVHEVSRIRQQAPRSPYDLLAIPGDDHARPRALEERHTKQLLDLADLLAEARLTDSATPRSLDELAGFRDRDDVLQLA